MDIQGSDESASKHGSNGGHTLDSSPTSAMSLTSTGSTHTAEVDSCTTSPATISQASISPTSPKSRNQTTLYCRACSKKFTGSPQNAKSNLQRHRRESPRHNKYAGLKCLQPECHMRPPMRSDNLEPHLLNKHKISSPEERRKFKEDSRLLASRIDSDRTPRCRSRRR